MNDFDELSDQVRDTLDHALSQVEASPLLIGRLVNAARAGDNGTVEVSEHPRPGWLRPLLVAAAVAIIGGGAAVAVTAVNSSNRPPASHPVSSPAPVTPTSPGSHSQSTSVSPPSVPFPAAFHAAASYFAAASNGWVLGDAQCATGTATDCATLIHTADGGATWEALAVPPGLHSTQVFGASDGSCSDNGDIVAPCVNRVLFATANDGYLWSFNSFYSTTDGGHTWRTESGGRALDLVSDGVRVVRLSPVHSCSAGCAGKLQVANVGTTDWKTVTPGGETPALFSTTLGVGPGGFTVELVDITDVQDQSAEPPVSLYRSTDATTWSLAHRYSDGYTANGAPTKVDSPADGSLIALNADSTGTKSRVLISVSTDGGATFGAKRPSPAADSAANQTVTVAAVSSSSMVAAISSPTRIELYWTGDAGKSWTLASSTPATRAGAALTFVAATTGYLTTVGQRSILVTSDGGRTWAPRTY